MSAASPDPQPIAGVDEAGRGPLAGPVVAAAVILDPARPIAGLADSKQLTAGRREELAVLIREHALCWALGRAEVEEIDRLNILRATLLAMRQAVEGLSMPPAMVLVDGTHTPEIACPSRAIIRGDATVAAISAASIWPRLPAIRRCCGSTIAIPVTGFPATRAIPRATISRRWNSWACLRSIAKVFRRCAD